MFLSKDNPASPTHISYLQYNLKLWSVAFQTRTTTSFFAWFTPSGGLRGLLTGLQPGAQTFRGPPILKLVKNLICEQYTIRCKRYHRQLDLMSRSSMPTHWNCFVDRKVHWFFGVWSGRHSLTRLVLQGLKNQGIPSACLVLVSDAHTVSTSFEHRPCRQPWRKLWTC